MKRKILPFILSFIIVLVSFADASSTNNDVKAYNSEIVSITGSEVKIKIQGNSKGQFYFEPLRGLAFADDVVLSNRINSIPHLTQFEDKDYSAGFDIYNSNRLIIDFDLTGKGDYVISLPVYFTLSHDDTQFIYGYASGLGEKGNDSLSWPSTKIFDKRNDDFITAEEVDKGVEELMAESEKLSQENPDIYNEPDEYIPPTEKPSEIDPSEPYAEEVEYYIDEKNWHDFSYNEFDHIPFEESEIKTTPKGSDKEVTIFVKTHNLEDGTKLIVTTTSKNKGVIPDKIEIENAQKELKVLFDKVKETEKEINFKKEKENKIKDEEIKEKEKIEKAKQNNEKTRYNSIDDNTTPEKNSSPLLTIGIIVIAVAGITGAIYLFVQKSKPKF